jgi:flagellar biosynthesis anti-sigma factor FlgM
MKIDSGSEITNYINKSALNEARKIADKNQTTEGVQAEAKEGAIVDLSQRSKDIQKVQDVIHAEQEIRLEKVEAIKQRIENGEYEIDFDATAEKIVNSFFDEMP